MRRSWLRPVALLALIVGGLALVRWGPLAETVRPEAVAGFFRDLGGPWWAPVAFVGLYVFGTTFGVPGSALTLAGGAIFGVALGTAVNWLGATLGATLAFVAARALGREWVARFLRGRAASLDERIGSHGFRTVLYLRLIPLVPFNGLNFGAGITRVRARDYVLATALGIVPGCVVYTYFADALIRGSAEARTSAFINFAIAAAALVAFTLLTDFVRRRIERRTAAGRRPAEGAGGSDS